MREPVTTKFRSKSFATRVVSGWNKLPEEVVDVGSVRGYKGDCTMFISFVWRGQYKNDRAEEMVAWEAYH